jgi:FdhD protein
MQNSTLPVQREAWRAEGVRSGVRLVPEESAVALTYNGGCQAVMMATPQDLQDFAVGFSLNEGIVGRLTEIRSIEAAYVDDGIDLRMWLDQTKAERLRQRRRYMAGPTGCGLCGMESIAEAVRPCAVVGVGRSFFQGQIMDAVSSIAPLQKINIETRAVHAAAFWNHDGGPVTLREDVGRHNALDKLAGALARQGTGAEEGIVLLTSRVSVEMVQKTAAMGAAMLVSISAPTAAAVRMARAAGITLIAVARSDGFEVFTHSHRVLLRKPRRCISLRDTKSQAEGNAIIISGQALQ